MLTIDQQLERLKKAVAQHEDWRLSDEHIYSDEGHSGALLNRPGLDRLRDQAALAAFEVVLITAPDRLARKQVCASGYLAGRDGTIWLSH